MLKTGAINDMTSYSNTHLNQKYKKSHVYIDKMHKGDLKFFNVF